ncbi:MAG: hypothetical protein PHN47_00110 [Clostridia bacterium]|jgi:electron transfer flavoprotein alpha/beta subunit|nr:hypothetical protein [Clostridia bacterium]
MKKNIAIYLDFLPHPASLDVGTDGYAITKRQVNYFDQCDIAVLLAAIKLAKTMYAETIIYSIGKTQPLDLVARAMAIGIDKSLHIGNSTWQGDIPVAAKAAAFCDNAGEFDLLLTPNSVFAVMVAEKTQFPVATSVSKLEPENDILNVIRKLPRGKRQQVKLALPAILGLISTTEDLPLPTIEALMLAQTKEQPVINLDYSGLYRTMPEALVKEPDFQVMPLAPATKIIWQPDSQLSAGQRLAQLAEGSVKARHGKQVTGTCKECAEHIVEYMLAEGLIVKKN